jgi:hypothetical protein
MAEELAITRDALLVALRNHIGRKNGVTVTALAREVLGTEPSRGDERIVRKLVVELRREGHHVCAHPANGYYLAANADELADTIAFLRERAMSSLEQIAAMKHVSLPDLFGQLHLPT